MDFPECHSVFSRVLLWCPRKNWRTMVDATPVEMVACRSLPGVLIFLSERKRQSRVV
jgi:hypothetical protein